MRYIGGDLLASDVSTVRLQNFRKHLIDSHKKGHTINNHLAAVKAMFNWASDNEVISSPPKLRVVKKITVRKVIRQTFTPDQIETLLRLATPSMRAMIQLGLNCGFGCTDCAELKWSNLDLAKGRVIYPRGKTGVDRNVELWPETIEALQAVPFRGELVFYTKCGNPYVQQKTQGGVKYDYAISKEFAKLLRRSKIPVEKGTGFYTLRRTAATLTALGGDVFAVKGVLGHSGIELATTYVQNTSPQTDQAIRDNRARLVQGRSNQDSGNSRDEKPVSAL